MGLFEKELNGRYYVDYDPSFRFPHYSQFKSQAAILAYLKSAYQSNVPIDESSLILFTHPKHFYRQITLQ